MKDYTGLKSGRLTVIGFSHKTPTNHVYVKCKCECGKEIVVRASCILRQTTKSCGCYALEKNKERSTKHGMYGTRLYSIWAGMRRRCYDPKVDAYKYYGARGITYCEEWDNFKHFYKWAMENGYKDNLTIDRIDFNGNYCPENCRWVDNLAQARNRGDNKRVTFNGITLCLSEWAEKFKINYETFLSRLRRGYSFEEALFHKKHSIRRL